MSYMYKDYERRDAWAKARRSFSPEGLQGIGTSEVSNACGHGFGTPLELLVTKAGQRGPFRGSETSERGKHNELSIRACFAMNFKRFESSILNSVSIFPKNCHCSLPLMVNWKLWRKDTEPQTEE